VYGWKLQKRSAYWSQPETIKSFFDELASILKINKPEGWYNVDPQDVVKYGGKHILSQFGSLIKGKSVTLTNYLQLLALNRAYPHYKLKPRKATFIHQREKPLRSRGEYRLTKATKELFPHFPLQENAHFLPDPTIDPADRLKYCEFDV
jgi:hypothetical protein